ncbi:MAG: hypothetical protein DRP25_00120 [Thermotoga sp.]|nr:MAG: hypothetical protein DRP25_00120 [Thermotoga sp.]
MWQEPTLMSYLMECFQGNYDSFRTIQLPNTQRGMKCSFLTGEEICVFERKNEIEGAKRNREVIEGHNTEGHVNHLNTKRRMRFVMRK